MAGDAFPFQVAEGSRRPEADKAQINLARFEGPKLFGGSHVEEVERNVREGPAEGPQRFREQPEVGIGQVCDVQLARLAPVEALHGQDAFRRQGQNAPGVRQERTSFSRIRLSETGSVGMKRW